MIRLLLLSCLSACAAAGAQRYDEGCRRDYDACKRRQDDGQCEAILARCAEQADFLRDAETAREEEYEDFLETQTPR